ncbi:MAG: hypothetical protein DRJ41_04325 [Thermoprotei archaeon]|nr:MAG: hypothetical protein DRJ41_04325 [Thermoprotei archaeon]
MSIYRFLNEILIINKDAYKLLKFELYVDEELMYRGRADGVIVATTTGSSAYALSAGGPFVDPSIEASVVVPLAPFSSLLKPLVLSSKRNIRIKVLHDSVAVLDGYIVRNLPFEGEVSIKMGEDKISFIKFGKGRPLSWKLSNRLLDRPWSFKLDTE